jgi:protein TonB
MLQELVESRPRAVGRRPGRVARGAASVAVHAAAVGLAVAVTGRAATPPQPPEPPRDLVFVAASPTPAVRAPGRAGPARGGAAPVAGPRPVSASPVAAPVVALPDVDVGALPAADRVLVDADAFARGGLAAAGAAGGPGVGAADGGAPGSGLLEAGAVDEPVVPLAGNRAPRYPEALRAAGVEGRAAARFVVDTLGRVEPASVRVTADHPALAEAVRAAVAGMRFRPARAGGVRVRQLAEAPFAFSLRGGPR